MRAATDELDSAVRALRALALVDLGREREAVAVSLTAPSHHLPRHNRSLGTPENFQLPEHLGTGFRAERAGFVWLS